MILILAGLKNQPFLGEYKVISQSYAKFSQRYAEGFQYFFFFDILPAGALLSRRSKSESRPQRFFA